ncbi:MAG: hypothetical protein ACAI44_19565, partial [Candidatus Sericytochromatia bacterium]
MFVLFVVLSILVHVFLLIAMASSSGGKVAHRQRKDMETMKVAAVNLPPEKPPSMEPPSPPPQTPRPDRIIPKPLPHKPTQKPISTATPRPNPLKPTPAPTPVATPIPGPTPTPNPVPTPSGLSEREQFAKNDVMEAMKSQGVDVSQITELPPGFKNWEEYAKFLDDGYEEKAWKAGLLPENTKGPDGTPPPDPNATPNPNATPVDPNATPDPNVTADPNASGNPDDGNPGWSLFPNHSSSEPSSEPDQLDEFEHRNIEVPTDLNLNPSSEPLPQDYKLGDLGAFKYIQFDYDGRTFKGQWST